MTTPQLGKLTNRLVAIIRIPCQNFDKNMFVNLHKLLEEIHLDGVIVAGVPFVV